MSFQPHILFLIRESMFISQEWWEINRVEWLGQPWGSLRSPYKEVPPGATLERLAQGLGAIIIEAAPNPESLQMERVGIRPRRGEGVTGSRAWEHVVLTRHLWGDLI